MWQEVVLVLSGAAAEQRLESRLQTDRSAKVEGDRHYHVADFGGGGPLEVVLGVLEDEYTEAEHESIATRVTNPRLVLVLYMELRAFEQFVEWLADPLAMFDLESPGDVELVSATAALGQLGGSQN